jgi:tetratricopeptide (TPR) repeat protein
MAYDDVFIYKMPGFYGDYGLFEGNFSGMIADFWTDFMKSDRDFATKIAMENTYLEAITYIHEEVSEQLSDAYYLLGNLYEAQQSYHQAIVNYQDAYRIRQQIFGSRHAYTLQICLELAVLHEKNGDMDKANAYKAFVVAK